MKIFIDTDVLGRHHLTLSEFLVLLMGYHSLNIVDSIQHLIKENIVQPNLFDDTSIILSNNTKDLVSRIIVESNPKVMTSNIDFLSLAAKLQSLYPEGCKPGTSYSWRDSTSVIAYKLMTLVAQFDFSFTEQEAVDAVREYVSTFTDTQHMQLLKYFILKATNANDSGFTSNFMTIIENNR